MRSLEPWAGQNTVLIQEYKRDFWVPVDFASAEENDEVIRRLAGWRFLGDHA